VVGRAGANEHVAEGRLSGSLADEIDPAGRARESEFVERAFT
jgi:hypothetical protein